MGKHNSSAFIPPYCTFDSLYFKNKRQIFSSLSFYIHAAINTRGLYLGFAGEEKFCFGSFCLVKLTFLLSIPLPTTHSYVIKFFQNHNACV